jgi:hypothetical protein
MTAKRQVEARWADSRAQRWFFMPRAEAARLIWRNKLAGHRCYWRYGETHIEFDCAHLVIRKMDPAQ